MKGIQQKMYLKNNKFFPHLTQMIYLQTRDPNDFKQRKVKRNNMKTIIPRYIVIKLLKPENQSLETGYVQGNKGKNGNFLLVPERRVCPGFLC